jgi:hypothetical protein
VLWDEKQDAKKAAYLLGANVDLGLGADMRWRGVESAASAIMTIRSGQWRSRHQSHAQECADRWSSNKSSLSETEVVEDVSLNRTTQQMV